MVSPISTINFRNHRPCFIIIVQYFDGPAIDVTKPKNRGGEFCVVFANILLCCVSITEGNRGIFGFCTEKLISFSVLLSVAVSGFAVY